MKQLIGTVKNVRNYEKYIENMRLLIKHGF